MKLLLQVLFLLFFYPCFAQHTTLKAGNISADAKKIKATGMTGFNQGAAIIEIGNQSALMDNKGNFITAPGKFNFPILGRNVVSNLSYRCGLESNLIFPQTGIFNSYSNAATYVLVNAKGNVLYTYPGNSKENYVGGEDAFSERTGFPVTLTHNPVEAPTLYLDYEFIFSDGAKASLKRTSVTCIRQQEWSEGMLPLRKSKNELIYGYLDKQGKMAVPFSYDAAEPFSEGMAAVAKYDGMHELKWGFIDKKGKLLIPLMYSNKPGPFSNGLAKVIPKTITDFSSAFIDKTGAVKFKFAVNDNISNEPFKNGWLFLGNDRNMDTTGKFYTDNEFRKLLALPDSVVMHTENIKHDQMLLTNQKGDRVGLYNFRDHSFIPPVFCHIGYFDEMAGLAYAALLLRYDEKNGKNIYREGYINNEGVFVIIKADAESNW
ncbi:WG repeat-containing protein [Ferruginibacter sp.]